MSESKSYIFNGAVFDQFGKLLDLNWSAQTFAPSEKKARSNIMYQYKRETGMGAFFPIRLEGKIEVVE